MIRILGIPFETEVNFLRGASLAPAHIRWHMWGIDTYSIYQESKLPELSDLGDVWTDFDLPPEKRLNTIFERVRKGVSVTSAYLFLGGDHTITWVTTRALRERFGDFSILHLDAHLDRWDDYGGKFSHATVMRRLEEEGFVIGTFGYRTVGAQEYIPKYGNAYSLKGALDFVEKAKKVFLSLDVDVLDPSEFPCVSNPEPMGVSFSALVELLASLRGKLLGAEIVEYLPTLDQGHVCGSLAAILFRELAIALSDSSLK